MRRELRLWQFSMLRLLLVLSASAVIMPFVVSWLRKAAKEPAPQQRPTDPTDLTAYFPKGFRPYDVVVNPNDASTVELTRALRNGGQLRLLSTKRQLRNPKSGEIISDCYQCVLSLEWFRHSASPPQQVWTLRTEQHDWAIIDYTSPYGFEICDDKVPILGLAFFDDHALYFAEIDLRRPASTATSPNWETFSLSRFLIDRFDDANWEPRFAMRNLKRDDDGWSVEVGIKGETLSLKRTGYRQWVELPSVTNGSTPTINVTVEE